MKTTAVILAAGEGKRMKAGMPKQYLLLEGRPVLFYSVSAFEKSPIVDEIVLVVGEQEREGIREEFSGVNGFRKVACVVAGGRERYDSVYAGLKACGRPDYVLIHDGARPLVSEAVIERCLEGAAGDGACAAGMPVKDTIKLVDGQNWVEATPDRSRIWMVQTPQAFRFELIREAYSLLFHKKEEERAGITDDAMVVENMLNQRVRLVKGSYYNMKITTPEDLEIARTLLIESCVGFRDMI